MINKWFFIFLFLLLTSNTQADDVFPLSISSDSHYLADKSGNPFLINGDTPWGLMVQPTTPIAKYYIDNRAGLGFNTLVTYLLDHEEGTYKPNNIYNNPPFTGSVFATPNDAYFAHVDTIVQYAASKGMLVILAVL